MSKGRQSNDEILDSVLRDCETRAGEWIAGMQAKGAIEDRVRATLDKQADNVVLKLLGFDGGGWGINATWQLDHCNGRSGNSAAGDWLRERAADAVRAWLDDQVGKLPPLPKTAMDSLRVDYKRMLEMALRRELSKRAEADAAAMVAAIVAKTTGQEVPA